MLYLCSDNLCSIFEDPTSHRRPKSPHVRLVLWTPMPINTIEALPSETGLSRVVVETGPHRSVAKTGLPPFTCPNIVPHPSPCCRRSTTIRPSFIWTQVAWVRWSRVPVNPPPHEESLADPYPSPKAAHDLSTCCSPWTRPAPLSPELTSPIVCSAPATQVVLKSCSPPPHYGCWAIITGPWLGGIIVVGCHCYPILDATRSRLLHCRHWASWPPIM